MDRRQAPNLEEMDERQAHQFVTDLLSNLSAEEEYEIRHEDHVMEMPQSGQRIRGREKMREFQETFASYSNAPSATLRRVVVREGLWIVEGINDYGDGQVSRVVAIFELREGKVWRDTRYYAEPFEAPEWRAQLVERMESQVRKQNSFCRKPRHYASVAKQAPDKGISIFSVTGPVRVPIRGFLCTRPKGSVVVCT